MDIIFVLAVAISIEKSCSQILKPTPTCFKDGDEMKLECTTADFNQVINFLLDTVSQGGCSPSCAPNIVQSGTISTYTLSFSTSTHSGNWTCSYGSSVSPVVVIAVNPCSSGGDGTGLTPGAIVGIVFAVLVVVVLAVVAVPCCILNTKCKFGDTCRDSNLSFTFPPEIKRTITPKSDLDYVNDTPDEERKGNLTPESEPGKKEVTTYQEPNLNYKLNNEESSIAQFTKRSGAFQQLEPVNKGEVGNRNGEYFKPVVTKYDESKKMKLKE